MRGTPYFVRIPAGLRKPKITRLGVDVAGQVEAVGRNVTQFRPCDEVFGMCKGCGPQIFRPTCELIENAGMSGLAEFGRCRSIEPLNSSE